MRPNQRLGVDGAGNTMTLVNDQHDWPSGGNRRGLRSTGIDHHEVDASWLRLASPATEESKIMLGDTQILREPDRPLVL